MRTRHTFTATLLVTLLAIAGVTAAIAADPPPPRIAFVANGRVPADALAAGPTAGQLGAPIYTTEQGTLPKATSDALDAYDPQLVIVLGGPVAISDAVVTQISTVTGLAVTNPAPPPTSGVVRAAGSDRFATAAVIGELLGAYNPAALPAHAQAVDSDLLDGMDSSAFQQVGEPVVGPLEFTSPQTRTLTIGARAFQSEGYPYDIVHWGGYSWLADGVAGGHAPGSEMYAPVQLPDGAVVTSVRGHWYDIEGGYDLAMGLYRRSFTGAVGSLGALLSNGSGGYGSTLDDTINQDRRTIDNGQHHYFVQARPNATNHWGGGSVGTVAVEITYEIEAL